MDIYHLTRTDPVGRDELRSVVVIDPDPSMACCPGVRDARNIHCSGPGTAILTEIETDRCDQLVNDAVAAFGKAMRGRS